MLIFEMKVVKLSGYIGDQEPIIIVL